MSSNAGGSGVTRRRFLRAVGMTGGAGAMFATMGALDLALTSDSARPPFQQLRPADFTLSGRAAGKVLILGAGVAGLACAYELGKAGYDCTVLEAQNRVGGRNFTVRGGTAFTELNGPEQRASFSTGNYLNAGPARIAQWMVTIDYCRELGVPLEVFTNVNAAAYIYREKDGAKPGFPVRRRAAKADVFGYVSELLAKATDQGALDKQLTEVDKEKLLKFLRDFGDIGKKVPGTDQRNWDYTLGERRGYTQWPGATGTPGVLAGPLPTLSQVLASGVGRELALEDDYKQSMVMLQPVGGMDAIPMALAAKIGADRIKLNCPVISITNGPDQVGVKYRDETGQEKLLEADYCIATLPPNVMARVPHNLGPDVQRGLTTFVPHNAGKIGLEYRSRFWENDDRIYGGVTETDLDLTHIWYPSDGYHSARGVLVGYYNTGKKADFYANLALPAREQRALVQGAKIHGPKYRTELDNSFSIAWSRAPYIEGAWQKIPGGPEAPAYAPLNRANGRVYFAGDWLSHVVSWQHGAFLSAQKVVTMLHQRVLSAA
jgi:monoamine oxidase